MMMKKGKKDNNNNNNNNEAENDSMIYKNMSFLLLALFSILTKNDQPITSHSRSHIMCFIK